MGSWNRSHQAPERFKLGGTIIDDEDSEHYSSFLKAAEHLRASIHLMQGQAIQAPCPARIQGIAGSNVDFSLIFNDLREDANRAKRGRLTPGGNLGTAAASLTLIVRQVVRHESGEIFSAALTHIRNLHWPRT